ncbi:MAG: FapA family protein [bacterium]
MSHSHYVLEISPSEMEAFLTIIVKKNRSYEEDPEFPSNEEILRYLKASGIVYGINLQAIERYSRRGKYGETLQIAKGKYPIAGSSGSVEYFVRGGNNEQMKIDSDKFESIQSKFQAQYVQKGDLLIRKLFPNKGFEGITVTGNKIRAAAGKEIFLCAGRNTHIGDEEQTELRASADGVVSIQGDVVHIDGTKLINSDVDSATGNISFPGNIVILRDVKDGMIVRAGGNIEVNGQVEDALLDASGDIKIKGSFIGSGKGEVHAGGDVHVRKIFNQTIKAGKSVFVYDLAQNAIIMAGERIAATFYDGVIEGGHIQAKWNIVTNVLGNSNGDETIAEISGKAASENRLIEISRKLESKHIELKDCYYDIQILESLRNGGLPDPNSDSKIRELSNRIAQLEFAISTLDKEEADIERKIADMGAPGTIQVRIRIFPGAMIKINDAELKIKEILRSSLLKEDSGMITRAAKGLATTI